MIILYLTGTSSLLYIEVKVLEENTAAFSKPCHWGTAGTDIDLSFLGTTLSHSAVVLDGTKLAKIWIHQTFFCGGRVVFILGVLRW